MRHAKDPLDGFLTPEDFAARLHVPTSHVRRWIRDKRLPAVRIGRLVVVPSDALRLALDESRRWEATR